MDEPIAAKLKKFLMDECGFTKKTSVEIKYARDPIRPTLANVIITIKGPRRE